MNPKKLLGTFGVVRGKKALRIPEAAIWWHLKILNHAFSTTLLDAL